jgi:hypothetical protein
MFNKKFNISPVSYDPFAVEKAGTPGPSEYRPGGGFDPSAFGPMRTQVETRYLPRSQGVQIGSSPKPLVAGGGSARLVTGGGSARSDIGQSISQSRLYENLLSGG